MANAALIPLAGSINSGLYQTKKNCMNQHAEIMDPSVHCRCERNFYFFMILNDRETNGRNCIVGEENRA